MFHERLPSREASSAAHLARMIALLGPPPVGLLERGAVSDSFFDKEGRCIRSRAKTKKSMHLPERVLTASR